MISGGCGSGSQLTITKPTGSPSATIARYQGLACGYSAASASDLATSATNFSCPGATRRARTASRLASVISSSVTATGATLRTVGARRLAPGQDGRTAVLPEIAAGEDVDEGHQRDQAEESPGRLPAVGQVRPVGEQVDPHQDDRDRVQEADQELKDLLHHDPNLPCRDALRRREGGGQRRR